VTDDDQRDEETRMREVPSDQPTDPGHEQPTVERGQETPPGGTPTIGYEATREQDIPPPPPPPPGYGETQAGETQIGATRPGETYGGDETRVGDVPPPPPGYGETQVGETQERDRPTTAGQTQVGDRDQTTQAAVIDEPTKGGGDEDWSGEDEYQWHTGKRRESTAESDAVEFIDVKKTFGRNTVLNGLNLGIPDGQISMILGPSGTGKSVCIKHMVGLLYPDEGDVLVHGESVPNMADDDLFEMRKKFGVLFQDGALFGSMNLWDNVAFPLRQHTDKGEDEIADIVNRRLKEVGLGGAGDKMPNELSGGMRKRAGFARALVLDPQIVLFDEPDSGLDPVRTALLCELIQEIHEENGGAYVVITHDIMSARRVAEYIAILWKGRIVESGPAEELFNSDNQFVRQFLSGEARGPLGME
jgi:phospholipid/cholesterol/gamma-HCH transport system ATP-binding protein